MQKAFDFNLIKFLVAIVDTGTMAAASERLELAPSGVSYAIKKLREHYNDPLFIKVKTGIQPTPLALELYDRYSVILQEMESAIAMQKVPIAEQRHRYRVRTNSLIEHWLSYYVLNSGVAGGKYHLDFAPTNLDPETRLNKLRRREVDLDIGFSLVRDANIYSEHLFDVTRTVICKHDHPRVGSFISKEDYLQEQHAIWSSTNAYAELSYSMEEFLERRDEKVVLSSDSLITLILAVANSELLMLIPSFFMPLLTRNFKVREVKSNFIIEGKIHIYAYMHKYRQNDDFIRKLIEIMKGNTAV